MAASASENPAHKAPTEEISHHNECAVCLERFTSPRLLPCFHTFCLSCINNLTKNVSPARSFPCPSCRTLIQIPPNGAEGFQVNFYVEAEMERSQAPKAAPGCDVCGSARATHKCIDCNQFSCDNCTRIHSGFAGTRSHAVVNVLSDNGAAFAGIRERYCSVHTEEKLRFFCSQCDEIICRDCKLTSHDGHTCLDVAEKARAAKQVIDSVTDRSRQNLEPKLKYVVQLATDHKGKLLAKKDDIKRKLRETADRLKQEVDACVADTEKQLDSETDAVLQIIQSMEGTYSSFQGLCRHAENVLRAENHVEVLEFSHKVRDFFGAAQKREVIRDDPTRSGTFSFGVGRPASGSVPFFSSSGVGTHREKTTRKPPESCKLREFAAGNWQQNVELYTSSQQQRSAFETLHTASAFGGGGIGFGSNSETTNLKGEISKNLGKVRKVSVANQVAEAGVLVTPDEGLTFRVWAHQCHVFPSQNISSQIAKELEDINRLLSQL